MIRSTTEGAETNTIRCAIYTRKSTEEGLEQEYNTLDAQWDACESYIQSQKSRGWITIPTHYDDGGFTGANTDRPAFNRLMSDVKAGLVDTVIVYKVDRLSRSLADFANMMEIFDKQKVAFVSVTQYFDTSSSIGRMTLNILITFAQFEREMISERIRDKIYRSRVKGKYMGGQPVLGYDVIDKKLIINDHEKFQVRKIFDVYLNNRSTREIVDLINGWGWTTKRWQTKRGHMAGGKPFAPQIIYTILKNPIYIGKIRHNNNVYEGEHEAIVDPDIFASVQGLLKKNSNNLTNTNRKQFSSILNGILICSHCGSKMMKTYTSRPNNIYSYYICLKVVKYGRRACANPSVPSTKVDEFVINHIKSLSRDPKLIAAFLDEFDHQKASKVSGVNGEIKVLTVKLAQHHLEKERIALDSSLSKFDSLDNIADNIEAVSKQLRRLESQRAALDSTEMNAGEITVILNQFFPIWDKLTVKEQFEIMDHIFEQIFWDGKQKSMDFQYSPLGLKLLYDRKVLQDESLQAN